MMDGFDVPRRLDEAPQVEMKDKKRKSSLLEHHLKLYNNLMKLQPQRHTEQQLKMERERKRRQVLEDEQLELSKMRQDHQLRDGYYICKGGQSFEGGFEEKRNEMIKRLRDKERKRNTEEVEVLHTEKKKERRNAVCNPKWYEREPERSRNKAKGKTELVWDQSTAKEYTTTHENVWTKRKEEQEMKKDRLQRLIPKNAADEQLMLNMAIELSKLEYENDGDTHSQGSKNDVSFQSGAGCKNWSQPHSITECDVSSEDERDFWSETDDSQDDNFLPTDNRAMTHMAHEPDKGVSHEPKLDYTMDHCTQTIEKCTAITEKGDYSDIKNTCTSRVIVHDSTACHKPDKWLEMGEFNQTGDHDRNINKGEDRVITCESTGDYDRDPSTGIETECISNDMVKMNENDFPDIDNRQAFISDSTGIHDVYPWMEMGEMKELKNENPWLETGDINKTTINTQWYYNSVITSNIVTDSQAVTGDISVKRVSNNKNTVTSDNSAGICGPHGSNEHSQYFDTGDISNSIAKAESLHEHIVTSANILTDDPWIETGDMLKGIIKPDHNVHKVNMNISSAVANTSRICYGFEPWTEMGDTRFSVLEKGGNYGNRQMTNSSHNADISRDKDDVNPWIDQGDMCHTVIKQGAHNENIITSNKNTTKDQSEQYDLDAWQETGNITDIFSKKESQNEIKINLDSKVTAQDAEMNDKSETGTETEEIYKSSVKQSDIYGKTIGSNSINKVTNTKVTAESEDNCDLSISPISNAGRRSYFHNKSKPIEEFKELVLKEYRGLAKPSSAPPGFTQTNHGFASQKLLTNQQLAIEQNKEIRKMIQQMRDREKKGEQLTDEEIKECKKAFALFDRDGDGEISTRELESAMRSMGYSPTVTEIQDLLNEFDPDGMGTIDFPNFLVLMAKKLKEYEGEESLRLAFRVFDKEDNGTVTVQDFRYMMENLRVNVEVKEVDEMIKEADKNHSGMIAYNEFITMITAKQ